MDERQCFDCADDALSAAMRACDEAGLSAHDTSCVMLAATVILCDLLDSTSVKADGLEAISVSAAKVSKKLHEFLRKRLTEGEKDS